MEVLTIADIVFPGLPAAGPIGSAYLPTNTDLVIYRGDYVEFFVNFVDDQGAPLDLTGYTVQAQFRPDYGSTEFVNITAEVTDDGSKIRVYIPSALSSSLELESYIWDLQITNSNGDKRTFLTGDVTVLNEVTEV